jgi:hypothetical protein
VPAPRAHPAQGRSRLTGSPLYLVPGGANRLSFSRKRRWQIAPARLPPEGRSRLFSSPGGCRPRGVPRRQAVAGSSGSLAARKSRFHEEMSVTAIKTYSTNQTGNSFSLAYFHTSR